jgi:hypothetical protein
LFAGMLAGKNCSGEHIANGQIVHDDAESHGCTMPSPHCMVQLQGRLVSRPGMSAVSFVANDPHALHFGSPALSHRCQRRTQPQPLVGSVDFEVRRSDKSLPIVEGCAETRRVDANHRFDFGAYTLRRL